MNGIITNYLHVDTYTDNSTFYVVHIVHICTRNNVDIPLLQVSTHSHTIVFYHSLQKDHNRALFRMLLTREIKHDQPVLILFNLCRITLVKALCELVISLSLSLSLGDFSSVVH